MTGVASPLECSALSSSLAQPSPPCTARPLRRTFARDVRAGVIVYFIVGLNPAASAFFIFVALLVMEGLASQVGRACFAVHGRVVQWNGRAYCSGPARRRVLAWRER